MKTIHKVAGGGGLTAGTIALSIAMFNHWEGRNYVAVHLPFDPPGVITACGGITNHDWPWLKEGMKLTEDQCQKAIAELVPRYAAPVMKCIPSFTTFPEYRQAAIISFVINLGPGKVCGKSIAADLNAGRFERACNTMTQYVNANGKRLQGLANRRQDPIWGERAWCLRTDDAPPTKQVSNDEHGNGRSVSHTGTDDAGVRHPNLQTSEAPINVDRTNKTDRGSVPAPHHYRWTDYVRNWWRIFVYKISL